MTHNWSILRCFHSSIVHAFLVGLLFIILCTNFYHSKLSKLNFIVEATPGINSYLTRIWRHPTNEGCFVLKVWIFKRCDPLGFSTLISGEWRGLHCGNMEWFWTMKGCFSWHHHKSINPSLLYVTLVGHASFSIYLYRYRRLNGLLWVDAESPWELSSIDFYEFFSPILLNSTC